VSAFLSDDWFADASRLLGNVEPAAVELDGRVQFTCADDEREHRWGYVIEAGRLVAIQPGELADADVEVLQTYEDARLILFGKIDGSEALRRTRINAPGWSGSPPPIDIYERPELDAMPVLTGASLVTQNELSNGPFGHVSHWIEYVDGRVAAMDLGRRAKADVTVSLPYYALALRRAGELSVLEQIELGRVTGELGPLGALLGINESPEWERAQHATGRMGIPLAALGEVAATPSFRSAWAALAEETYGSQ
jgi:hypothetical protein